MSGIILFTSEHGPEEKITAMVNWLVPVRERGQALCEDDDSEDEIYNMSYQFVTWLRENWATLLLPAEVLNEIIRWFDQGGELNIPELGEEGESAVAQFEEIVRQHGAYDMDFVNGVLSSPAASCDSEEPAPKNEIVEPRKPNQPLTQKEMESLPEPVRNFMASVGDSGELMEVRPIRVANELLSGKLNTSIVEWQRITNLKEVMQHVQKTHLASEKQRRELHKNMLALTMVKGTDQDGNFNTVPQELAQLNLRVANLKRTTQRMRTALLDVLGEFVREFERAQELLDNACGPEEASDIYSDVTDRVISLIEGVLEDADLEDEDEIVVDLRAILMDQANGEVLRPLLKELGVTEDLSGKTDEELRLLLKSQAEPGKEGAV